MRRRIYALIVIAIFFVSECSFAASVATKFSGPLLTGCSVYQLGMDEFVLKLSGRNIPVPKVDVDDSSIEILIENAQAEKPETMNAEIANYLESTPLLYNMEIRNFSEDNVYKVALQLDANASLNVASALRTVSGYTFRIKAMEKRDPLSEYIPPAYASKPSTVFPQTSLPFTAGTRTTIEFRDAPLQDVFRMFMAALGRNIVLDSSFPRDTLVTMTLVDVRIDEIMNYFLRTYDIACYSYGPNITAFGTYESLYKLSGAKQLKVFKVSYASPQRIGELLKNLLGFSVTLIKDSTGSGSNASTTSSTSTGSSVSAAAAAAANTSTSPGANSISEIMIDERLRTLYVKTNPARMQEVEELISMLDVPLRQVMIRASIFEFNDTATLDVQNSLNLVYDRWTLESNPGSSKGTISYIDRTYSQGRSAFDRYITSTFTALESKNKGRTVANPSVITLEGEEAKITLKQDIMYSAGADDNGNPTWETREVGPELTFTPVIEDKGYINLTITINTGDYLGKDSDGNIITTDRNVETHIRVKDGMPFVVGGLFQDINSRLRTKMPVLGDIPLLGQLFQYNSTERNKTQAVMVVTPYILDTK